MDDTIGSGGGSDGSSDVEGIVNPDLSGRLFIGNRFGPWLLDLKTGRYSAIPGTYWEDNPDYSGLADYSAFPRHFSNVEYVETIEGCVVELGNDRDCIVTHNESGEITSSFELPSITWHAARLSRDGEYIAVVVTDPISTVNIYDRFGSSMRSLNPVDGIDGHQFDWLDYNEIIYASGQSLFISGQPTALVTVEESSGMKPAEPSISPDGSQVAFIIGNDTSHGIEGTIWVMNTDGSSNGVAERVTSENAVTTSHGSPVWSPEGNALFVVDSTSVEGNAYVIPSNSRNVTLDGVNSSAGVIPVNSYYLETSTTGSDPGPLSTQFGVNSGGLAWVPD